VKYRALFLKKEEKMNKLIPVFVVIGIILLFIIIIFSVWTTTYNAMVQKNEEVNNAWAQVQNQYQRRVDLIPNLVEIVKGYAKHEKETLEGVIKMRNQATQITVTKEVLDDPESFKKFQQMQGEISSALSRLMAITEAYPDLKANQNFLALQSQLEGTENRISVERKRFNEVVMNYNKYIKSFPNNIIAGAAFKEKQYFQAQEGSDKAPQIKFD
jgi:LemA protein